MTQLSTATASCPSPGQVDAWTIATYAGNASADRDLTLHLLACPHCRQRAAMAWALLSEPVYATMPVVPVPDLAFLQCY